jgi:hypothetical protein
MFSAKTDPHVEREKRMKKAVSTNRLEKRQAGKLFLWGIPLVIMTSYLFLVLQPDLRLAVPEMFGATALILMMLTITLYAGEQGTILWSPGVILFMAIALRMIFLFRAPELSDDIYRYLWDGLQTAAGHNPFSLAPSHIKPHDEAAAYLLGHINHPDFVTIYPPFAQLIFASGAALTHSLTGLKVVLVMLDFGTCFMIMKILSSMNLPVWRASLYAWHPLPVIEIAGSGHVDGAGILFVFIAVSLLFLRKEAAGLSPHITMHNRSLHKPPFPALFAGLAFAAAVFVKLIPLIYLPVMLIAITGSGSVLFFIGFLMGLILLVVPFLPDLYHMAATLDVYLRNWEFSNFAFRSLRDLLASGSSARVVLIITFSIALGLFSVRFMLKKKGREVKNIFPLFIKTIYYITFSFLLLTPTLHPWYALYLAALFPFAAGVEGLVLSWTVFLSYHVQIRYLLLGQWTESGLIAAVIWLAPVFAFILSTLIKRLFRGQVITTEI